MADRPPSPKKPEQLVKSDATGTVSKSRPDSLRRISEEFDRRQLAAGSSTDNTADNTVLGGADHSTGAITVAAIAAIAGQLTHIAAETDVKTATAETDVKTAAAAAAGVETGLTGLTGMDIMRLDPSRVREMAGQSKDRTAEDDHVRDKSKLPEFKDLPDLPDLLDPSQDITPNMFVERYKAYKEKYKQMPKDSVHPDGDRPPKTPKGSDSKKAPERKEVHLLDMTNGELRQRKRQVRREISGKRRARQEILLSEQEKIDGETIKRRKETIKRIEEICRRLSATEVLKSMKEDKENRGELFIEHTLNHLKNNVLLLFTKDEERDVREKVERAFADERGEGAQLLSELIASLDRSSELQNKGIVGKAYDYAMFWRHRRVRTLKKQVTTTLDVLPLRANKIEDKYPPEVLKGSHRHARELRHIRVLMHIIDVHKEETKKIEFAEEKIQSEIAVLQRNLAKHKAHLKVWMSSQKQEDHDESSLAAQEELHALLGARKMQLRSAEDAFNRALGSDRRNLDALDIERQLAQVEKEVRKNGTHSTQAFLLKNAAYSSVVTAIAGLPLTAYAVYLAWITLHPSE